MRVGSWAFLKSRYGFQMVVTDMGQVQHNSIAEWQQPLQDPSPKWSASRRS